MKRKLIFILVWISICGSVWSQQASMSDQEIRNYVEIQMSLGKSQQQIVTELSKKGVTPEQAERIKKQVQEQSRNKKNTTNKINEGEKNRNLLVNQESDLTLTDSDNPNQKNLLDSIPAKTVNKENEVFGRNIFRTKNLTFEPTQNMATPMNYRLGPGDEVIIDVWGDSQTTIREVISPDGLINIPNLGLISLVGQTVQEASTYLRKQLNQIYSGVDSDYGSIQMKLTLGHTRTIQVNVMGEVFQPGTYNLSSFSSVFHALYVAGGVSDIGSLRYIQLVRNGKKIAEIDVYAYLMEGLTGNDMSLQEGDVILVPPYDMLVKIEGTVKRPMKYEMKQGETVEQLLKYAGNFSSNAYQSSVRIIRQNGREYQVRTVDAVDFSKFLLKDGDLLTAEGILDRYENRLEIKGAVYHPGIYELSERLNTVHKLIQKAEGVLGDAFMGRAVLHRQREDLTREVLQVDIKGILNGTSPDIPLRKNDVLYIPSIHDLMELGPIEVVGEVVHPGTFVYADNMTLEDVIIQAGGLLESASIVRVDVSRRIKNNKANVSQSTVGKMFSFSLKEGFVIDGTPGFILQPFDQVYVRKSPGYRSQANVIVDGEVLYEGIYSLTNKSERLSDLVKKAGGVTSYAYVKGAKLVRQATEEELARMTEVKTMMARELGENKMDSLKLSLDSTFTVGINLDRALMNPGSDADIVLREGDKLVIPELVNTVKINGAVLMPNTVSYHEGKSLKYYLSQAGGLSNKAQSSKAFIIYMNGQAAKIKGSGKQQIQPGCEIVVPVKNKNPRWTLQSIVGMASSLGSLGLTAASIANILK